MRARPAPPCDDAPGAAPAPEAASCTGSAARELVEVRRAPPSAAHWLVCAIWRSLPAAPGPAGEVTGVVPANVYGCLNVITLGEVRAGAECATRLPECFLTGPFTRPLPTRARAPLRSLSLVLHPWVLQPWFGRAPAGLVDELVDAAALGTLADPRRRAALDAATRDPAALDDALLALAAGQPPLAPDGAVMARAMLAGRRVGDAARAVGLGERQFERRFVETFGLRPVAWRRVKRFEGALARLAAGEPGLAELAASAGYADQAHMTRDFRRIAAATPGDSRTALATETPGAWALRAARRS